LKINIKNVIEFIKINNNLPSRITDLGSWINSQEQNYKNRKHIMKNEEFYNKWTQFISNYKEYFLSNTELWCNSLEQVINYIDINKKRPSSTDKNIKIKSLGYWCSSQQDNYKKCLQIMKDKIIYNKWTEFINRYGIYFLSNEEKWETNLNNIIKYINTNNKLPSINSDNEDEIYLTHFLHQQQQNYKNKKKLMNNEDIYNKWTEFIQNYKEYFLSNEERWYYNFDKVINYIETNNKLPSITDINKEIIYIGLWIKTQNQNYKNKKNIMVNNDIYKKWVATSCIKLDKS
jgi:hypothetical protein